MSYSTVTDIIECETPKSPPGDYNECGQTALRGQLFVTGVKHLNPRQGITTRKHPERIACEGDFWCETPKSPPGDYNS